MPVRMNNRFVTHRVNLFEPDLLFSINCLAFNPEENKLAVLRRSLPLDVKSSSSSTLQPPPASSSSSSSSSTPSSAKLKQSTIDVESLISYSLIEIWDWSIDHRATLSQVIHEDEDDPSSIESLGWSFDGRLWACGLNGKIHQVDLVNNVLHQGYPLVSGAGWCLQFNKDKTLVAVGTEEGYICIFNVAIVEHDKYGIDFVKTMSRDKARILCVTWYEPLEGDKKLISGSIGIIKIWNYENGNCLNVIRSSNENTIFWSLTIADDFTIISGDSKGFTSFWDGKNALLINQSNSHKADVLCLTQSAGKSGDSHRVIYSSGTDPNVVTFTLDSNGKGVQSTVLHIHSNDVRSLVASKGWLISGGFDCYLTQICAFPQKQIHQAPVFNNFIKIDKNRLLFQYSKSLQIWETGSTSTAQLNTSISSIDNNNRGNNNTNHNNNNNNNSYHDYRNEIISFGDSNVVPLVEGPSQLINIQSKRLIHQSNFSGPWICYSILEKVRILYCANDSVTKVPLLCDLNGETITGIEFIGDKYLLLSTGLKLYMFQLTVSGITLEKEFKYKHRLVKVASSNEHIVVVLANLSVSLISTTDWSLVHRFKLSSQPTCLKFNQYQKDLIWFAFANHLIMSFSISSAEFTKYSYNESSQHVPLIGLTFHPNGLIAYDQDRLYHYNGSSWTTSDRYSHLAAVEFMADKQELLLIEVTPSMIKKKLPIRFSNKKFGT